MKKIVIALILICTLAACAKPLPPEKASYAGEWQSKTMYLLITQDGSIRYKRLKGGVSTSIEGPIKGFEGDNFEAGIGPMSTSFIVSKPPYQDGDQWKMVVDGEQLTRSPQ